MEEAIFTLKYSRFYNWKDNCQKSAACQKAYFDILKQTNKRCFKYVYVRSLSIKSDTYASKITSLIISLSLNHSVVSIVIW